MLRNKLFILFLILGNWAFSQSKKVDTIYVYEEIIIRDTVFIEKPFSKIDKAVFISEENKKDKLELTQNGVVIEIPVDTLVLITDKKRTETKNKSWFFGGKFHFGLADNSLFEKMGAPKNTGLGLGVWTQKKLFDSDFSIGIGFDVFYWMSPFSTNAQQKDGELNGYYFTEKNEPKLFHSIESKHFQLQIPIQLYYKFGKLTPSVGWFVSTSNYKTQFLGSSGTLPLKFDQMQTFKAETLQIGYLIEMQYAISERISVAVHFDFGKFNNLVFTNKDNKNQIFKIENSFTEARGFLQLIYKL